MILEQSWLRQTDDFPKGDIGEKVWVKTLLADNECIWEQKHTIKHAPFPMPKEGAKSLLGVVSQFVANNPNNVEQGFRVGLQGAHRRGSHIGEFFLEDEAGNTLRDVRIKGNVHISRNGYVVPWETIIGNEQDMSGLYATSWAVLASQNADKIASLGVRTYRSLGVLKLKELAVEQPNGEVKLIPIEQIPRVSLPRSKEHGVLLENFEPALEIQAVGINTRLIEIISQDVPYAPKPDKHILEERRAYVQDAISYVREFVDDAVVDLKGYTEWFAETLGENLGYMHRAGLAHGGLTLHNITLDCSIMDTENVKENADEAACARDVTEAKLAIESFAAELLALYPELGTVIPNTKNALFEHFQGLYEDARAGRISAHT